MDSSQINWTMKEKEEYDKLSVIYDDLYAPTWPDGPNLQALMAFLMKFPGGNNICEVGVGTGNVIGLLYNLGFKNFTGVDLSPKMMKIAKQKVPGLITIEQDMRETNYSGFDWIISVGSIYNRISNEDKKELFIKMYNEMDEGALFFVSMRHYEYNYNFKNEKIITGFERKHRFRITYKHKWVSHDCYYGIAKYFDSNTKQTFHYTYKTYVISEKDLLELAIDVGFKCIDSGTPDKIGYYATVWVFQK